jgi:peptidyl-prolyl cis-trans isomerase SurA
MARQMPSIAAALTIALVHGAAIGQQTSTPAAQTGSGPAPGSAAAGSGSTTPSGQRVTLDRVVAVVNGDLILESDVDAERRFAAFQPLSEPSSMTQDQLIERLIDRDLILQQMKLQPQPPITDAEVDAELAKLRKTTPACAADHCETDGGWEKFIADHGFTLQEVQDRWRIRMEVLRFVEERFRLGIRISQSEIDDYYKNTLMAAYKKDNVTPPPESSIAERIQEVLLQQRVTVLLNDWLKALRAQGSVRMIKPGEAMP